MMSNKMRTTLCVGVTGDLETRVLQHKCGHCSAFTAKYKLKNLMYYENIMDMQNAIDHEKHLKRWHREWKWNLIKKANPGLKDLAADWYTDEELQAYKTMMDKQEKDGRAKDAK